MEGSNIQAYINRVFEYIFPSQKVVKKERFEGTEAVPTSEMGGVAAILMFLVALIFYFSYAYGAAKLSWHYNIYVGNGSGSAFFYSLVCFFFSGLYYPFYALFLNPLSSMKRANLVGGRR
jgi:hypothetical protein